MTTYLICKRPELTDDLADFHNSVSMIANQGLVKSSVVLDKIRGRDRCCLLLDSRLAMPLVDIIIFRLGALTLLCHDMVL